MFLAGFFIWNVDNIFCRHLTTTKQLILLPWSVVLEGHGWWHILTGLGETPFLSAHSIDSNARGSVLTSDTGGM